MKNEKISKTDSNTEDGDYFHRASEIHRQQVSKALKDNIAVGNVIIVCYSLIFSFLIFGIVFKLCCNES